MYINFKMFENDKNFFIFIVLYPGPTMFPVLKLILSFLGCLTYSTKQSSLDSRCMNLEP